MSGRHPFSELTKDFSPERRQSIDRMKKGVGAGVSDIMSLIAEAPWREAVTYRETWPHEYVLAEKDKQHELIEAFCDRIRRGEGVECRFFHQKRPYLFLGGYKYWMMTHWNELKPGVNYVINRALLFRDRRDFVIQDGDSGRTEDYPAGPEFEE